MNRTRLQLIFKSYIEHFEDIETKHDESYKWEIAQKFQDFDVEAEDFAAMLTKMWKASENITDSSHQLPFYALVDYVSNFGEIEVVREMFHSLFEKEILAPAEKQDRIDAFIQKSEELRMKHKPDSYLYKVTQGAVMQLLFLRYPNSNYGYKASQAKRFADCIGFYDDWGPMSAFHLDVYYRMCDQVLAEIKQNSALLETHRSRYEETDRNFHADEELHILLFDIIYSSQTYNLYAGIESGPVTAQARKLHLEKVAKAQELEGVLESAQADADMLAEALTYLKTTPTKGLRVQHKTYGEGIVQSLVESVTESMTSVSLVVEFSQGGTTKKLDLIYSLTGQYISFDDLEFTETIMKYIPILKKRDVLKKVKRASEALIPYLDYLS